jgi:hypothetical protein
MRPALRVGTVYDCRNTEQMNGSLERFVRDVAPRVKAAAAAA